MENGLLPYSAVPWLNGVAFFGGGEPFGVWRTDGTPEGTFRLGPFWSNELYVRSSSTHLFWLVARDEGAEVWASDGTRAGTRKVVGRTGNFSVKDGFGAGDSFVFLERGVGDNTYWMSDGSPSGTAPMEIDPPGTQIFPARNGLVNGGFLFWRVEEEGGFSLIYGDGSAAGTTVWMGPGDGFHRFFRGTETTRHYCTTAEAAEGNCRLFRTDFALLDEFLGEVPLETTHVFDGWAVARLWDGITSRFDALDLETGETTTLFEWNDPDENAYGYYLGDELMVLVEPNGYFRFKNVYVSDGTAVGTRLVLSCSEHPCHGPNLWAAGQSPEQLWLWTDIGEGSRLYRYQHDSGMTVGVTDACEGCGMRSYPLEIPWFAPEGRYEGKRLVAIRRPGATSESVQFLSYDPLVGINDMGTYELSGTMSPNYLGGLSAKGFLVGMTSPEIGFELHLLAYSTVFSDGFETGGHDAWSSSRPE